MIQDSLQKLKEMQRKIDDNKNYNDENDDEEENEKKNRKTLNKNDAINVLNKSSDKALCSLSKIHLNKSIFKLQTLLTAQKRV